MSVCGPMCDCRPVCLCEPNWGPGCDCGPMGDYESVFWSEWACVNLHLCDYGPGWAKA